MMDASEMVFALIDVFRSLHKLYYNQNMEIDCISQMKGTQWLEEDFIENHT